MLIDATINLDYDPDPDFGGAPFSAHRLAIARGREAVRARWKGLGLSGKKSGKP